MKADDGFAKTQPRGGAGRDGPSLEIGREVRAGGTERWQQSKEQNRAGADGEGEGEEAPVDARCGEFADRPVEVAAAGERGGDAQERHDPRRHQDGQNTRSGREHAALDEHLAHETGASRSNRQPDRDLAPPRRRPTDEQAGDVGAGNQQQHACRSRQQHQGATRDDVDPRVVQGHRRGRELILRRVCVARHCRMNLSADDRELRASRLDRDIAAQSSNDRDEILIRGQVLAIRDERGSRGGDPCLGKPGHASEAARRNADHRERDPIQFQRRADDVLDATEPPLPDVVADHDRMRCRSGDLVGVDEATAGHERRAHHVEVRRGHDLDWKWLWIARTGHRHDVVRTRGDAVERSEMSSQQLKAWPRPAVPQLAFARCPLCDVQHGEAVGVGKRRSAKHRRVHEAEDRCRASDAEGEGEERGGGEHRRATKRSHGVSQIVGYRHCGSPESLVAMLRQHAPASSRSPGDVVIDRSASHGAVVRRSLVRRSDAGSGTVSTSVTDRLLPPADLDRSSHRGPAGWSIL